jgi:hypothetical protein
MASFAANLSRRPPAVPALRSLLPVAIECLIRLPFPPARPFADGALTSTCRAIRLVLLWMRTLLARICAPPNALVLTTSKLHGEVPARLR